MSGPATRNKRKIREAVEFLKNSRRSVLIKIEGQESPFTSKIIKADHGDVLARPGTGGSLLIETLRPDSGNDLMQIKKPLTVNFSLGKYDCEFTSHFIKKSRISPYYGHIITYPECIRILNRRRYNRYERGSWESPIFLDARLTMKTVRGRDRYYDFTVFDLSEHGVGILAGEDTQNFVETIDVGYRIEELELLAAWMTIKVSGTVKHKSKLNEGKYAGCCLVGIQLDERLEHCV